MSHKIDFIAQDDGAGFYTDADNPLADALAIPGLLAWFQSDPAFAAVSGEKVTAITDLAGGAATLSVALGRAPRLTPDIIRGEAAVDYRRVDEYLRANDLPWDRNGDFTGAALFRCNAVDVTNQAIVYGQQDTSNRANLWITQAGKLRWTYGVNSSTLDRNILSNTWYLALFSLNEAENRMRLRVNGVTAEREPMAANAGGVGDVIIGALGAQSNNSPLNGYWTDLVFWSRDLLGADGADDLRTFERYMFNTYAAPGALVMPDPDAPLL